MFRLPAADAEFFRGRSDGSLRRLLIEWVAIYAPEVAAADDRFNQHRAALGLPPVAPPARHGDDQLIPLQLSLQSAEVEAIDELAGERHLTRSAFLTEVVRRAKAGNSS